MGMKFTVFSFLLFLSSVLLAQNITVMSYNIKCDYGQQDADKWDNRKSEMVELINRYNPDILGEQEAVPTQMEFLDSALNAYSYIGVGRDNGENKGEYSAIFYKINRLTVLEQNTFWLSKTPNKPTKGWDAACYRVCTYGFFEDKATKQKFWVFNTHFDHKGNEARTKSAQLIIDRINQLNTFNYPVFITGDFNLTPESRPIEIIKKEFEDTRDISEKIHDGSENTYNGFTENISKRIDYIFVKNVNVLSHRHIDDKLKNNRWISDHLPVFIEVLLKNDK